jgi:hypothetical protein
MADFNLSTEVNFINRQGDIVAAKIVKMLSDTFVNLIWWNPDTGLQSFAEGVMYSDVVASGTFHTADKDLMPKNAEEAAEFQLTAVESSGLENAVIAPGTGQVIQPVPGIPAEQQVTPTDGKAAEKAVDPMEVPATQPVVITDPPQEDRTGTLNHENEQKEAESNADASAQSHD